MFKKTAAKSEGPIAPRPEQTTPARVQTRWAIDIVDGDVCDPDATDAGSLYHAAWRVGMGLQYRWYVTENKCLISMIAGDIRDKAVRKAERDILAAQEKLAKLRGC